MRSRLFLASLTVLLAVAGPALARGTLDSILPQIRSAHPGRLSDAEPWTDSEGRTHYKIKWLTPEGRVLYFNADADSGRYSAGGDDIGRPWRGERRPSGEDDAPSGDDGGARRSRWNGGDDDNVGGPGIWNRDRNGSRGGEQNNGRGGDWRDRHGDGSGGWNGGRGGGRHHQDGN